MFATSEGDYRPENHELLNERYLLQKILGNGVCSRVWKCYDKVTNRNVAVKIAKNSRGSKMMARAEINILKALSEEERSQQRESKDSSRGVVGLLETFTILGGFTCLTIDLLGSSLLPFAEQDGIPIDMVHGIIRQILEGLQFIHSKNIIHSDIKPENIAICKNQHPSVLNRLEKLGFTQKILRARPIKIGNKRRALNEPNSPNTCPPVPSKRGRILSQKGKCGRQEVESSNQENQYNRSTPDSTSKLGGTEDQMKMPIDMEVKIFDFGLSFSPDKSYHGLTDRIQTAEYRCPEAILVCEKQYSPVADVWSVGCMAFELWAGELLMREITDNENEEDGFRYCSKEEFFHLKQICKLVGPFPTRMLGKCSQRQQKELKSLGREVLDDAIKRRLYAKGEARSRDSLSDQELTKFAEFIQSMLVIDPEKRPKAVACLQHHWLRDRIRRST